MLETDCGFIGQPEILVRFGPTMTIRIGLDPDAVRETVPDLPDEEYQALVDTGAQESCIDSSVAVAMGLPVIDRRPVAGAHGSGEVNIHLAPLYVPALNVAIYGAFAGVHLHAGGQPHSALTGRTFPRHFTMTYNGETGSVILSGPAGGPGIL